MVLKENERWRVHHGDCIEHMATMPRHSVDFSIFSPPFPALFAYTDQACDIGNSESFDGDARLHLFWFVRNLFPIIKPGRVVIVHVQNISAVKRTGQLSTIDLRGIMIRLAMRAGFIYERDWVVTKNPQSQSIRTRSRMLMFSSLEADRANSAPAQNDCLIKLRAPGDNAVPVIEHPVSRNDWIKWAEGAWSWRDIRETETLNTKAAKSEDDTRHICPLQLPVINRAVRLYTNPGEVVFSPFAGIGSEGYESIRLDRKFYGCEIKDEYYRQCVRNLESASVKDEERPFLFEEMMQ